MVIDLLPGIKALWRLRVGGGGCETYMPSTHVTRTLT